jgi:hypothetical protein
MRGTISNNKAYLNFRARVESVDEMMRLLDECWEIDRELNGGGKFIINRRT